MTKRLVRWRIVTVGNTRKRIPMPTLAGTLILLYLGYTLVRLVGFYGEWRTFVSDHYGYSIEYPGRWVRLGEYTPGVGHKNLHDLNVEFGNGDALLIPTTIVVRIYHRTIPEATLDDAVNWGAELINTTGGARYILPLEKAFIGVGNYPAFIQVDQRNRLSFVRRQSVYVVSGDDAFLLELEAPRFMWDKASRIFDHMLASFQLPTPSGSTGE